MSLIGFRCPNTGREVTTGIDTDHAQLARMRKPAGSLRGSRGGVSPVTGVTGGRQNNLCFQVVLLFRADRAWRCDTCL
jgi:hypothetical protein